MAYVSGSNPKIALSVWGRKIVAFIMCAILYMSMYVLGGGLLSDKVGYRIIGTDENGQSTIVEEHYFEPGETADNVQVADGQQLSYIKEMSPTVNAWLDAITCILMLILLGAFPYSILWELGSRDDNGVQFGYRQKDMLRGLKIGALAGIPSYVLYVLLLLAKGGLIPSFYLPLYRILNIPYLPLINAVVGKNVTDAAAIPLYALIVIFLTLLFIPAVCCGAYILGFRQYSIHEHIVYQRKKK